MPPDAQAIAEAVLANLGSYPTPQEVEKVMRPFGVISQDTEREIDRILHQKGTSGLEKGIGPWIEANEVVSGKGAHVERRIQFLLMDTCTCVLDHLPTAIDHATKDVDPRIQQLLKHKYFSKADKTS